MRGEIAGYPREELTQLTFAAITPALIVGAFAERVKFSAVLVFLALWLTFAYLPIAHMVWYWDGPDGITDAKSLEAVKTPADSASLPFFARATLASAAAWSPDPKNPPLYLDLPTKEGAPQPDVLAKWTANAPLAFMDQYIGSLRRYRAISLDVGDQDGLRVDTEKLHEVLDKYGIANTFEVYSGTHTSKVAERFQNHVMPFFSQDLCFQANCQ